MSFYDHHHHSNTTDGLWSAPGRQSSSPWEHPPPPPSRSGGAGSMPATPATPTAAAESAAFASQFEEIDRATDNLVKSGKWFPGAAMLALPAASLPATNMPVRRESMPLLGDARLGGPPTRHASVGDAEATAAATAGRPGSAGLQGYFHGQRFPGARPSEAEQMLQAKRRMAAQRERELRNYHQEQQYNRTVSGPKPDRAMSPTTMSEEERRELIARQHRALYGDHAAMYGPEAASASRHGSQQDLRVCTSVAHTAPSLRAFESFGGPGSSGGEAAVQHGGPPRDRTGNTTSPVSAGPSHQPPFGMLHEVDSPRRNSESSPRESPPLGSHLHHHHPHHKSVAPIGTRPQPTSAASGGVTGSTSKRSTTPLTPSGLSYGFSAESQGGGGVGVGMGDERSTSAASNPGRAEKSATSRGGWGAASGAWATAGGKNLAVQPSVWG